MRFTQSSALATLHAVTAFLDAHADRLGAIANSGTRKSLDQVLADLEAHKATQAGSHMTAKGASKQLSALRKALYRDRMAPISVIAKAALPGLPPTSGLILPSGKLSSKRLLELAPGMVQAAAPYADTFVAAGLPVDFIAQLKTAADTLQAQTTARTGSQGKRSGATQGVKVQLSAGSKLLDVLNTLVKSALAGDSALLAEWNSAKRVRNTAIRPSGSVTPLAGLVSSAAGTPATPAPPAPATATTSQPAASQPATTQPATPSAPSAAPVASGTPAQSTTPAAAQQHTTG